MTAMPSLLVSILNALLVGLHTLAVAAFGLYFKLQTFVYMPGNGLIQGMRPIVSYNYGAGQGTETSSCHPMESRFDRHHYGIGHP